MPTRVIEGFGGNGLPVYRRGNLNAPRLVESNPSIPELTFQNNQTQIRDVRMPTRLIEGFDGNVRMNEPGWMNINCGYNPDQLDYNLPSNYPAGQCQMTPDMAAYNRNIFTQNAGEGVYFANQISEPINSNIGISFAQTLNPITKDYNHGQVSFVEHDPRVYNPPPQMQFPQVPAPENVYDPRLTGYGTSYRGYTDPFLGQPKFMYDDIDAVRAPPYISRSNIDFLPFADSIGIKPGFENGNPDNSDIRALTQKAWFENSTNYREDLQSSLMRKYNSTVGPQRRMAPIHTNY